MPQLLAWVALGLGVLTLAHAAARMARRPLPSAFPLLVGGVAASVVLAALATLPTRVPWSPGQSLWPGLLLGGVVVLLGAFVARPSEAPESYERGWYLASSGAVAAATMGVALLVALFPANVLDPLAGFALGAVIAGVVVAGGVRLTAGDTHARTASLAELTTLVAVTLAATTYLSAFHRSPAGLREWLPLPVLLTAALAVGLALASYVSSPGRRGVGLGAALVPFLILAALAGFALHGTPGLFWSVLLGVVAFALVSLLGGGLDQRIDTTLVGALVVLGALVIAFRERHGFGMGLATLAGLAVVLASPPGAQEYEEEQPLLRSAATLALLATLYRVFAEHISYTRSPEPDFLYYYAALLGGALLPAVLASLAGRGTGATSLSALLRGLLGVGLALAAPLAVWLLIGERPQAAFLLGLAVGVALLVVRPGVRSPAESTMVRLLPVGMALSALQLTILLQPLAMRTRWERIGVLGVVAVVALIAIATAAALERGSTAQPTRRNAR